ncbi:hypothetical protein TCK1_1157 [Pseudomonas monteilii]|uniref:Lipoprotein n=1 Tax=Pseudomonas monteilii TaxID=76759 RepID=A0AAE6R8Q1_9PSED|nr:hypothetical protein [Pseudomonas monteilii]QHB26503.1 hypothetical protein TCK1_1157 [Pseudomonas monteilii]
MRILIGALGLALVAGCASVSETRNNPPLLDLKSEKPAKDVAECIRDSWQSTTVLGASVGGILQSSGNRYSVLAPDAQAPLHLVDVEPSKAGSTVKYHFYRTWQSPLERVTDAVKACVK